MAKRKRKKLTLNIRSNLIFVLLIILIVIIYIKYIHDFRQFKSIDYLQEPQIIKRLDCSQWNDIKDMRTINDVTNSTMVDTMNYLNKVYCPIINDNMEEYLDDFSQNKTFDIAHVLNIYRTKINDYSYLFFAAPVTFISMLRAKQEAMKYNISVGLYSSNYVEDNDVVPIFINKLPALNRSLQTSIWAQNLTKPKKLPFVSDIIDSLYDNVNSKYIVYTNADIGLQPNFYVQVFMDLLKKKESQNGVTITRKSIGYKSDGNGEILSFLRMDDIYTMGLKGEQHGGYDCFVFKREYWKRITMENVFLGYPTIGKTFMKQLIYYPNTAIIRNRYLTFHIGTTRRITKWLTKNGWRNENQSIKYDEIHHQHSQLNRGFCDDIQKRLHLK